MQQTVFVLALLWRHRIRYAFEKFLWTGKVDEGLAGVKQTLQSNLSSDKLVALPRIASDVSLCQTVPASPKPNMVVTPSQSLSATSAAGTAGASSASNRRRFDLPYDLPVCRFGVRLCGCPGTHSAAKLCFAHY